MTTINQQTTTNVFNYIRGAIRSAYGVEDLSEKSILFVGMGTFSQEILKRFCNSRASIYFISDSLMEYYSAYTVCEMINPYGGEAVDIIVDVDKNILTVNGKLRFLGKIDEGVVDAYTQGIHDFYL